MTTTELTDFLALVDRYEAGRSKAEAAGWQGFLNDFWDIKERMEDVAVDLAPRMARELLELRRQALETLPRHETPAIVLNLLRDAVLRVTGGEPS